MALDFLIEKWDEAGNVVWTKQYDRNSAEDILNGVTGLASRIYAAGTTRGTTAGGSDAALLQIDPATGDLLSTTLWGGVQDDSATGIATDGQDLYLVGNTASFGAGGIDMVLLRYTIPSPEMLLTITKSGTGTGTVNSSPAGIDCGTTCSSSFTTGSQVTLTAVADTRSAFSGWSGEGCSGTGTCIVTMDTDKIVTATFIRTTQLLTLNQDGTGTGTVIASPAGASGIPHNGALINSPAWTSGTYGNGLSLSNGQYVSVPAPTPDIFNITGDLTISLWINPNSVTCSGADPGYALISKRSSNHATPYELYIGCGGSLILHYWGTNIQYPGFSSTGVITTGVWQHVAATRSFNGTNATVTFFINGVEAGSSTQNTGPALGSSDPLWISRDGYHTGYTSQGSYSGLIDEVQMYNRSVSAAEVARIYTNTSDALPNRVGNWKFDESSGTTAADTVTLSCVGNCSDTYTNGSVVNLSTAPGTGSVFSGWSGNTDCSDGLVVMDTDKSCTATFDLTVNGACGISNGGTFTSAPTSDLCTYGTPTTVNGSGPWTWNCTGFYGGTTADCAASIQTYTLTITKTGAGTGTVTSSPAGINCGATCSAPIPVSSTVVLFQTPGTSSGFSGWGNACSGTGDCAFSMSSDKGISADFTSSPMVKNQRTGVAYSLLQTAYTEALHGDTIMALTTLPAADLTLNETKSLTIVGGYDADYTSCLGLTTVFGPVTVKALTRMSGVAVRALQSSTKAITAFSFASPAAEGVIDEATHTIAISVPSGTDVTALVPTITHSGAGISPASGEPRDFTSPVVYTVTAEDLTTQDYMITVTTAPWATCGDVLTYAGDNYPTVQIGTQCWLAKNLNTGTMIPIISGQGASCSSVQKYCYNDTASSCTTYGGLYTWNQAMCGAQIEGSQGICPAGWHIPSDPEYVALTNFLGPGGCSTYRSSDSNFCGAPAGDRMKADGLCQGRIPCGDTGFNGLLGGSSYGTTYYGVGEHTIFWTSSISPYINPEAWRSGLSLDQGGVDSTYWWSDFPRGRTIRCLKD
ncbi:MAG: hypothetical protein IPQ16_05860 [Geobacteraceae bacterium]|nr:hypothetical protein [Geobacteraceae bacterium]